MMKNCNKLLYIPLLLSILFMPLLMAQPPAPVVPGAPVKTTAATPASTAESTPEPGSPPAAETQPVPPALPQEPVNPVNLSGLAETRARVSALKGEAVPEWPGERLLPLRDGAVNPNRDAVLRGMLREWDPVLRIRALEGLVETASPDALEELLWALYDEDAQVRDTAIRELQIMADNSLAPVDQDTLYEFVMTGLLSGEAGQIGCLGAALPGLAGILCGRMLDLLQDKTAPVMERSAAAWALGRMDCKQAVTALKAGLWEEDEGLSWTCGQALLAFGNEVSTTDWQSLLTHVSWYMRELAVDGLAQSADPEAVAILCGVVENPDCELTLRQRAVWRLMRMPGDAGFLAAIGLLETAPGLREYISKSLKEYTGRDFASDTAAWRGWVEAGRPPLPQRDESTGDPFDLEYMGSEQQ